MYVQGQPKKMIPSLRHDTRREARKQATDQPTAYFSVAFLAAHMQRWQAGF